MPIDVGHSPWVMEPSRMPPGEELYGVGADLLPATIMKAYRTGLFPMGLGADGGPPLGWWCPDPRGILLPGGFHVSRSLRRSRRRYTVTVDGAFDEVVLGCADPSRPGRWITPAIRRAYRRLHDLGWAHSVEVWEEDDLAGGLYGVAVGGLFAGESMFHRATDASKVALWALSDLVFADGEPRRLIDVQWRTPHLAALGVVEVPRRDYLRRVAAALRVDLPAVLDDV